MSSKIKVDNIADQGNNNLINKCGSTITLGANGDTVALASGASQTGFGRTGTVDWQTTPKTATFTASNGEGYFCNTTSSAFTMNLPAGSAGAIVSVQDYNNTFDSNGLTIDPNGSEKINGGEAGEPLLLTTEGQGLTLVYVDGTVGWRSIHSDDFAQVPVAAQFVAATGGNSTATSPCGDYKIHTFTGPGTFCVSCAGNEAGSNSVEYIVVAGGGGGGGDGGGGGGAGGFRFASPSLGPVTYPGKPLAGSNVPVTATGFPITVGAGGGSRTHPDPNPNAGLKGSPSTFSTITATAGGGGGNPFPMAPYGDGGSGGGARGVPGTGAVGQGNTPPVTPPQGNDGGPMGPTPSTSHMGGGGGALAVGSTGQPNSGGPGGNGAGIPPAGFGCNGAANPSPDSFRYYAGGGGGATDVPGQNNSSGGLGGGGGGVSRENGSPSALNGTANTGGGGGGGGNPGNSGSGGSGVVIIRYKFQ